MIFETRILDLIELFSNFKFITIFISTEYYRSQSKVLPLNLAFLYLILLTSRIIYENTKDALQISKCYIFFLIKLVSITRWTADSIAICKYNEYQYIRIIEKKKKIVDLSSPSPKLFISNKMKPWFRCQSIGL